MHLTRALPLLLVPFVVSCVAKTGDDDHPAAEGEDLTVCASATVQGADVSEFQGSIDWGAYRASGRAFAIIRAADGDDYLDSTFGQNWSGAKGAGVLRGVYQFFRASQDGTAQANVLLQQLGGDLGELPPVADVEVTDGVGPGQLDAELAAWVSRIQAATGKTPIIYTSPGLWPSLSGSSQFAGETLWVADWGPSCPSLPSPWSNFAFWQYSDDGSIPGIGGAVDLDVFNGTLAQLQAFGGAPKPQGPPTAVPPPPSGCGTIEPGQGLVAGQSYSSCDGRFTVAMQTDGNLVLYHNGFGAMWASNTSGSDGYAAIMQGDGNFVLYGKYSDALWASGTSGHAGAYLAVQEDGNMVVYAPGGTALWATGTNLPPAPPAPSGCGTVQPGQGLTAGTQFSSCDGRFTLAMQTDGNLVLYRNGVGALWATGTNGKGGYNAIMQGDGNFVLYDDHDHALWASGTNGDGGATLAVQDDGNLVVYAPGGHAVWASGTNLPAPPPSPSGCTTIQAGQGLSGGEEFSSCNGTYTLAMQDDGNLVLYHNGVGAIWATGTNGKSGYNAIMQGDGNFVLYSTHDAALWASGTAGDGGATLAVQDDGNLVVYAPGGHAVWASGTNGK